MSRALKVDLSFIIPAKNEEESLKKLYEEVALEVNKLRKNYEIIFIDDGSIDNTFKVMKSLSKDKENIRVIKLRGNWGKSLALQAGFESARGIIIFTMDADLQDNPKEIGKFLDKLSQGYDLVSGWKKKRHDPITKVLPSRILNFLVRKLTGLTIHDTNCGFKAYKNTVLKNLNLYGELYRYIPIIAKSQNFKVAEIVIEHRKRVYGKSKFGVERNIKGFLDLITIIFLTGYITRPGHFFGGIGIISFLAGFIIGLYVTYLRISTGSIQYRHPLLFLGMLLMIIGIQLITTGLLAEMIVAFRKRRSSNIDYIQTKVNF